MKRSRRGLSKKGFTGLKRVGVGLDRHWVYKDKEYKTLREVIFHNRQKQVQQVQTSLDKNRKVW